MAKLLLRLQDLETGETVEAASDELGPVKPGQLLILPHECADELEAIRDRWRKEFGGDSHAIRRMRGSAIGAEWRQRRARAGFEQMQAEQYGTGLPMHHWDETVLERYRFMQEELRQAERDFAHALEVLQAAYAVHLASEKVKKETALFEEPKGEPPRFRQNLRVETIDGKVITGSDFTAAEIWDGQPWPEGASFWRDFYFPEAIVPEPYAWVLTHAGVTHKPTRFVSILYSQQEMLRISKLEMDTQSEFVLDGERLAIARRE